MTIRISKRTAFLGLAGCVAAFTGACMTQPPGAQPLAQNGRQCFLPSQVHGFHALDEDTVHVMVGANDVYELQLFGICPDVDWSQRIGIRSTFGNSWVCSDYDAELIVPSPIGTSECAVTDIRWLPEEEARASRAARH